MIARSTIVTAAQLKDLVANPVELVPAPGSGKVIVPIAVALSLTYITTAYVAANVLRFSLGDNLTYPYWDSVATNLLQQTVSAAYSRPLAYTGPTNDPTSASENRPLSLINTGVDLTTGDGILQVTIFYALQYLS